MGRYLRLLALEQWVDLGQENLADGDYVLRSVADPDNRMYESANKTDTTREGPGDNEGVTPLRIGGGNLVDMSAPSGTVAVNDVDPETTSSQVKLKLLGRDDVLSQPGDVENVDQVKVSNDGVTWATYAYNGANSTTMRLDWDLADTSYGGRATNGTKTVYAQFHDRKGNWSATETDTIELTSGTPPPPKPDSGYAAAVRGDGPAAWWRVGERSATLADSEVGPYDGSYVNGVSLGLASLLAGDRDNDSILLDGNKYMRVPHADALSFGTAFSLEAWIRPSEIPPAGGWASVVSKQNAYSLQFNGPRLEVTVVQGSGPTGRKRLQAPAGAIEPGRTYHVVATYDGAQQRLYIDGKEVASASLSGPADPTGHSLLVGSWDGAGEFFHGNLDEPAVYGSALSPARVQAHFDAGSTQPPPPPDVAAPTELKATASSSSQINLTWADKATDETGYVVERSTNASFTSPTRVTLAPNTASYADTGLLASTTYHYRIKAVKDAKSSDWSSTQSATTASPPPVAPPTGLAAKAVSASTVDLAWTDNATDETAHVLERSTDTGFTSPTVVNLPANARSYSDTNASPSTAYHYRVKAVRGGTSSTWSNAANVTTPSPPPPPRPAYAPTVVGDGPVGYWRLGERSGISAADEKKAVTGTYLGGPVLGAPSLLASDPSNTAARFDGVNDSVRFPTAASFNLTNRMTLEAWIQPRAVPPAGRWASVVAKAESYSLQFNGPRLEFTIVQSGVRQRLQAAAGAVVAGRKYHVVGTFDGTTRRLFINGTQVASARLAGGASTTSRVLRIGTWDGTGGEMLNGTVDDVAVYGKALPSRSGCVSLQRRRGAGCNAAAIGS